MSVSSRLRGMAELLLPPAVLRTLRYLRPRLRYAPRGWDTPVPASAAAGWDNDAIASQEQARWKAYCDNLDNGRPLGFSHEHDDLSVVTDLRSHNIHVTFAYVLALCARMKSRLSLL